MELNVKSQLRHLFESIAYYSLKTISHSRNLETDKDITQKAHVESYKPDKPRLFMERLGRYMNYSNKSVIDMGCGTGDLCIYLAKTGAKKVKGIDIDQERIDTAIRVAKHEGVDDIVSFECIDTKCATAPCELSDIVLSRNAFEHIVMPLTCLQQIYGFLKPGGLFGTIFGPLWLSHYGAHMWDFCKLPWIHLLFSERVVLRVRTELFRPDDPVECYEDIRGHLNRITVKRFRKFAEKANFEIKAFRLNPGKDNGIFLLPNMLINSLPILQELGSRSLLAVLRKPSISVDNI